MFLNIISVWRPYKKEW